MGSKDRLKQMNKKIQDFGSEMQLIHRETIFGPSSKLVNFLYLGSNVRIPKEKSKKYLNNLLLLLPNTVKKPEPLF